MCYSGRMDWIKLVCIALVVGVIGPLFWLGVQSFEAWLWRSIAALRDRRRRHPK